MKLKKWLLGEVLDNYDYLRKPLSSMQRASLKGIYPYYGAQGIIDYVADYKCDGEFLLIAEDGENLSSRNAPIAQIAKGKYWVNNHAHIVKNNSHSDLHYICYLLNNLDIAGYVTGSAQPKLSQGNLNKIKIALPSLPTQQKIASILSAYDRLIENNTRRIRLLEQMAENLHKEWFVRFRFPEHEKVEMVNGLPKGWKVEKIKECVKRLPFGRTYKAKELSQDGEVIVIDQSTSDFLGFHNNTPDHHATFNSPIILFGDHSCKFCLMTRDFSLGENIIPFISKDTKQIDNYYLYFATHKLIVTEEYKRHWGRLSSMKILIPTINIQQKFNKLIIKNEKMKKLLFIQNQLLTRQRDLLLPRLMSGKLEVKS